MIRKLALPSAIFLLLVQPTPRAQPSSTGNLWTSSVLALTTAQQESIVPIAVYVAAPVRDGFIDLDKAIQDSMKDLQNNIRNKRGLVVAQDETGADVTLRVLGRGVVSQRAGDLVLPFLSGVVIAPMYSGKKVVRVVLQAGDFKKDFTEFEDGYGDCAEEIARQAHAWINANRNTLIQRRRAAAPQP